VLIGCLNRGVWEDAEKSGSHNSGIWNRGVWEDAECTEKAVVLAETLGVEGSS